MDHTTLFPQWKQAAVDFLASDFKDGVIVPKAWFEKALGLSPVVGKMTQESFQKRQLEFMSGMDGLRSFLLLNHNIYLHTVHRQGYLVAPPSEQTALSVDKFERDAISAFKNTALRLRHIRLNEMDDAQRKENTDAVAKLSMLRGMHIKTLTE